MNRLSCLTLLAVLLMPATDAAAAEAYDNCTGYIDALPAVITTQGTWCLRKDVLTSISTGYAITVLTNNVTLDCNDFKIGGLTAGLTTMTTGIFASSRVNLTVRNCNIRGFKRGIEIIGNSSGHAIVDNRFDNNTQFGMFVLGSGHSIRGNIVAGTGQTNQDGVTAGIVVSGDADIIGNTVDTVLPSTGAQSGGIGISLAGSTTSVVQDNRVRNIDGGVSPATSLAIEGGTFASVEGNDFSVGSGTGWETVGVYCEPGNVVILVGNRFQGLDTPILSCDDDGNNLVSP